MSVVTCRDCGEEVIVGPHALEASEGVAHHVTQAGDLDLELDADHTPVPEQEPVPPFTLQRGPFGRDHHSGGYAHDSAGNHWYRSERGVDEEWTEGWECGPAFLPDAFVNLVDVSDVYVTAYLVTRNYGGPEEGGWYYDAGRVLESQRCAQHEAAHVENELRIKYAGEDSDYPLHSVLNTGSLQIVTGDHRGYDYPHQRPRYQ